MLGEEDIILNSTFIVESDYAGERIIMHKKDGNIKCFSEEKEDVTEKIPKGVLLEMKSLSPYNLILDGKVTNQKYLVSDVLYFNDKPTTDLRLYERKKLLRSFTWGGNVVRVPYIIAKNKDDLRKILNAFSSIPNNNGVFIKTYGSFYPLKKRVYNEWVKYG